MIYTFGDYRLDVHAHELRRAGDVVRIEPQVFAVLAYLVEHRDRIVTKEELLDHVWATSFVSVSALSSRIKAARQAVGDDGVSQRIIRTSHGVGYRFVAPVEVLTPTDGSTGSPVREPDAGTPITQDIRFCRSADGVRIAYATSGSGPPLVKTANWLSHLDYDWESPVWRHWLRALSQNHRLIRYDERGSGLSDREPEQLDLESRVADLAAVVEACELDRFPLMGLSAGATTSVAYAAQHPERVSRLILFGGFAQGRMARATSPAEKREAELMVELVAIGWGQDDPAFRRFFTMQFMPESTPEMWAAFDELQRRTTTPESAARLTAATADLDVLEFAPRVQAPTLVVHARGDRRVPMRYGRELATLIPGARFVVLDSPNHILQEGEPAWPRFLAELTAFFD